MVEHAGGRDPDLLGVGLLKGCAPRYSWQMASSRCHLGAAAPRSLPASARASSSFSRAPGRTGKATRSQRLLTPRAVARRGLTPAASARTVSTLALATQAASASPSATGTMVSALRGLTSPAWTAWRSRGRPARLRASRASFSAVLPAMPSRSRA